MSLLRASIAGRLLKAGAPSVRQYVPGTVRFESTVLDVAKAGESKEMQVRHNQPDYTAEVDQASS